MALSENSAHLHTCFLPSVCLLGDKLCENIKLACLQLSLCTWVGTWDMAGT